MFYGFSLDPFSLFDDGFRPAKVGIGGRDVLQALVIALMIVMFDERLDLRFQIAGKEVVFQHDPDLLFRTVLQRKIVIDC